MRSTGFSYFIFSFIISNIYAVGNAYNVTHLSKGQQEASAKEICMQELGCFSITSDFKSLLHRPINVLPNDRVIINTRFLLYTKEKPKESTELKANDKSSFTKSHFSPERSTKFIIHGFVDTDRWMIKMKDEFLLHGDYNIILVDWSGGSKPPYYQASANCRVAGAEVAVFIEFLKKQFGISPENCYVIGHSLGSHVAGYAGKRLKTLGRITALDPAEPYFQHMPITVRLDKSDANYVDVIHTDSKSMFLFGLGMNQLVGHVDFFPNNGRDQPGCKKDKFTKILTDGLAEGFRRFLTCNHQRSLDFYTYSINYNNAPPVSYQCKDYDTYLNGECSDCGSDLSQCAIMGIRANEYPKGITNDNAFYVKTSGSAPYWVFHYQVTLKLHKPSVRQDEFKGTLELNLFGSKEDYLAKLQSRDSLLKLGNKYQFLVTSDKDLGDIKSLTFKWFSSSKNPLKLLIKPKLYVQYVSVASMNNIEKSPRNITDRLFCGTPSEAILPKTVLTLLKNKKCDLKD